MVLETDTDRLSFTNTILRELTAKNGGPWKEIWCEPQPTFNEMVFWVLLFEDSDLVETHAEFCEVFSKHVDAMKPLEAALSYRKITDEGALYVESLYGNESILSALDRTDLGASARLSEDKEFSIFEAKDSKR